ncbi:hypothetical protein MIR68_006147 [Amoeboaphelidium protococcarum]|nr:hypothetical protein MIR68_006147 [Amoeboaphelidium protococcarum]KAI3649400.1 hypothetical protein MP228_005032 [Amoeboaphelidium protococcarum]
MRLSIIFIWFIIMALLPYVTLTLAQNNTMSTDMDMDMDNGCMAVTDTPPSMPDKTANIETDYDQESWQAQQELMDAAAQKQQSNVSIAAIASGLSVMVAVAGIVTIAVLRRQQRPVQYQQLNESNADQNA